MTSLRFHAHQLFDGEQLHTDQVLTIDNGKIIKIDQDISNVDVVSTELVAPGYIDLQVNGGGGVLFNDSPTVEKLNTMMLAHAKYGTTAMLPTLITDEVSVMAQAAEVISKAIANKVSGIVGVHFEGPHLSVAKKGTHCAEYIRPISEAEWQVLSRKDIGQIVVTLAPETVSVAEIEKMVSLGILVCLGHTNADYETTEKAITAGATGFTHLFNAMSPLQGREPGVVGSALLNDKTSCGLIVDGHHVDYASCQLAIKTKPQGQVFLVTDAMPPVGTDQTEFALYDRTVYLENGKLTSTTGELAGSSLDMASAVKNAHQKLGLSLEESIRMGSVYPAQYLYQNTEMPRGKLCVGMQADMVILNTDLTVKETWISGEKI
ncbi:N-acetylglucosamine-6-phosphate deacetylase [Colwellia sp. RSH04]|uniref:N-acetylglucosamine-6-phosphate deacetylase n=1 Tax=Colwellia sp. RSH04 TaxID=2305464 RepID=UPI000E5790D6|nr:N-acetylglucosamine-6-phosphate deacetylase [Colwellia sp. RSH04]RHW77536.1 N-acetylglucosamine-6-phosphate deacetylase [Colwellia sp. RSH04]